MLELHILWMTTVQILPSSSTTRIHCLWQTAKFWGETAVGLSNTLILGCRSVEVLFTHHFTESETRLSHCSCFISGWCFPACLYCDIAVSQSWVNTVPHNYQPNWNLVLLSALLFALKIFSSFSSWIDNAWILIVCMPRQVWFTVHLITHLGHCLYIADRLWVTSVPQT